MENIEYLNGLPPEGLAVALLLAVGKGLKDLSPLNNKWIPWALAVVGGVSFSFIVGTDIRTVVIGMICGFASTGVHQGFTQLSPAKVDSSPTPPAPPAPGTTP